MPGGWTPTGGCALQPDIGERNARTTPTALGPSTESSIPIRCPHTRRIRGYRAVRWPACLHPFAQRLCRHAAQCGGGVDWRLVSRWDDMLEQISAGVNTAMSVPCPLTFDIGGFSPRSDIPKKIRRTCRNWRELNTRWFQSCLRTAVPLAWAVPVPRDLNIARKERRTTTAWCTLPCVTRCCLYIYTLSADTWHHDGSIMRGRRWTARTDPRSVTSTTSTCSVPRCWSPRSPRSRDLAQGVSPAGTTGWITTPARPAEAARPSMPRAAGTHPVVRAAGAIMRSPGPAVRV